MQDRAPEGNLTSRERIRNLGFDPDHLTPEEQSELLAIDASLSESTLEAKRAPLKR